jgi:hypothetical protein
MEARRNERKAVGWNHLREVRVTASALGSDEGHRLTK